VSQQELSAQESDIVINEIMPNPNGSDFDYEWIELYNTSDQQFDLSDCLLNEKVFPEGTTIPPFDYIVIARDLVDKDEDEQSFEERYGNHSGVWGDSSLENFQAAELSINLKNSSDTVMIECENAEDSTSWENAQSGQSFSKDEDGEWTDEYLVTPGKMNEPIPPVTYSHTIMITEVYPSPNTQRDEFEWLELYNYGGESVNLSGWILEDNTKKHVFKNVHKIKPKEYQIRSSEDLSITLNNSGETLHLYDPNGELVDLFAYDSTVAGLSNIRKWVDGKYKNRIVQTRVPTPKDRNIYISQNDHFYGIKNYPIAKLRTQEEGIEAIVQGIVTVDKDLIGSKTLYLQDSTGGIQLYISKDDQYSEDLFRLGVELEVVGELKQSKGEMRLYVSNSDAIRLHSENNAVSPTTKILKDLTENIEGMLIAMTGEIIKTSGTSFIIRDDTGEMKIMIRSSTSIPTPKKKKGQYAGIIGILSQYGVDEEGDPAYRVLPRFSSDIIISDNPVHVGDVLAQTGGGITSFMILGFFLVGSGIVTLKRLR